MPTSHSRQIVDEFKGQTQPVSAEFKSRTVGFVFDIFFKKYDCFLILIASIDFKVKKLFIF